MIHNAYSQQIYQRLYPNLKFRNPDPVNPYNIKPKVIAPVQPTPPPPPSRLPNPKEEVVLPTQPEPPKKIVEAPKPAPKKQVTINIVPEGPTLPKPILKKPPPKKEPKKIEAEKPKTKGRTKISLDEKKAKYLEALSKRSEKRATAETEAVAAKLEAVGHDSSKLIAEEKELRSKILLINKAKLFANNDINESGETVKHDA